MTTQPARAVRHFPTARSRAGPVFLSVLVVLEFPVARASPAVRVSPVAQASPVVPEFRAFPWAPVCPSARVFLSALGWV